jgi:hypothetical protein
MAIPDVTEKVEIYHTLYQLSSAFAAIVGHCETLREKGLLNNKKARLYKSFIQETQGEMGSEVMMTVQGIEDEDWLRFGKVRHAWERYLKGPDKKTKKRG